MSHRYDAEPDPQVFCDARSKALMPLTPGTPSFEHLYLR
ncbi:hypothetical protein FM101_12400 [Arthrobacter rhombi]|uniref:Uncharacterized protein n=1 Tax=Arthrobacter rhombi TaxID=71253 RepID=A0A1R4GPQ4_9MICC|nr:hypothetical protein FM101_12400 [Arthrobacter rhombi]